MAKVIVSCDKEKYDIRCFFENVLKLSFIFKDYVKSFPTSNLSACEMAIEYAEKMSFRYDAPFDVIINSEKDEVLVMPTGMPYRGEWVETVHSAHGDDGAVRIEGGQWHLFIHQADNPEALKL